MTDERSVEVAVVTGVPDGCCTYCRRAFGSLVTWKGRNRFLGEEADHVLPVAIGGRVTVPACSLCNRIKGSLVFESLADIQDYLLDRLQAAGSITLQHVYITKQNRAERVVNVKPDELSELRSEPTSLQPVKVPRTGCKHNRDFYCLACQAMTIDARVTTHDVLVKAPLGRWPRLEPRRVTRTRWPPGWQKRRATRG